MSKSLKYYCKSIYNTLLLLLLLSCNFSCYAVELGPLQSYSYLDEPFSAEIELLDLGRVNLSKIKATLESKANLKLQCDVEIVKNRAFLHLWSAVYIDKSFLELVINLTAADKHITKSYTLLLDPAPEYMVNRQLTYEMLQQEIVAEKKAKALQKSESPIAIKKHNNKINNMGINLEKILVIAAIVIAFIAFICIIYFIFSKSNHRPTVVTADLKKILKPKPKINNNQKTADNKMLVIKLKLARQYIALSDTESAKNLLQGVIKEGNASLKEQAKAELAKLAIT